MGWNMTTDSQAYIKIKVRKQHQLLECTNKIFRESTDTVRKVLKEVSKTLVEAVSEKWKEHAWKEHATEIKPIDQTEHTRAYTS